VKISTEQLDKIHSAGGRITPEAAKADEAVIRLTDADLIAAVTSRVDKIPDRDDIVAALRAKIASGEYNPTGDEIADAIVRRLIADRIR